MSRAMKRNADIGFPAIMIEGGLIAPDQVQAIHAATPDQKMAADYGCPKGTNLRDEITRYFQIGRAVWHDYAKIDAPNFRQTAAFAKALLEQAFGFALTGPQQHIRDDRRYTIAWEAKGGRVPVVVAPPAPLEKGRAGDGFARALPEFGDGVDGRIARRSAMVLLQDWLNANPDFYWGLVFAGDRVRLMRDNASLTRPAWIEIDLGAIFRDDMYADFTAVWLLIHASRFGVEGAAASDCALEKWREAGTRAGTAARERLRDNVTEALLALGQGFLDGSPALRQRLDDGSLSMTSYFEQMLRIVYRLIFLAVAEDRDLLHSPGTGRPTRALYSENYGFAYLRDKSARRSARDHHQDAWEGVKIVFAALEHGQKLLGLPALGSLFGRGLTPDLDTAILPNRAMLAAIYKLAWLDVDGRRVRINWRDMATEELGSVYEGLLELVPVRENEGRTFIFAGGAETKGNARKTSGSYYTPDSLVQCLLDSALDPVLEKAEANGGVDAILDLNVIDPACGSGHFLLGAARRMATKVAQIRNPDAPDYNAAMRDVVRNCIHGVDRNPMAVELAKVALWIETVEPGKPLGFLDANIQCGDSLLGMFDLAALEDGIPDDAYKPLTGDDKAVAKHFSNRNKSEKAGQGSLNFGGGGGLPPARLAAQMDDLRHLPENTLAEIEAKRARFDAWRHHPRYFDTKVACDLYIAAFLLAKKGKPPIGQGAAMIPTTTHVRDRLGGTQIYGPLQGAAIEASEFARAFHWPLAFPEVIISRGGFDVVLGNPPWEVVQLGEEEYFASRVPEIAALKGATRKRAIAALATDYPQIFAQFENDKRVYDAVNEFARAGGRFDLTARGKVNTYGLFAELFLKLVHKNGRAGVILPTGIATDATSAPFFGTLISHRRLASLIDFENRDRLFTSVYFRVKFCLLTIGHNIDQADFAFFLTDPTQLQEKERCFTLSPEQISAINPNTKTSPIFRARMDALLTAKIYSHVPVLINENKGSEANPWNVQFRQGLFNMTSDSGCFKSSFELEKRGFIRDDSNWINTSGATYVPLYEAKMLNFFDHRYADFAKATEKDGIDFREIPHPSEMELSNPSYEISPRYWVDAQDVAAELSSSGWQRKWMFGVRGLTNATNQRTLVASCFPYSGVGNSFHVWTVPPSVSADQITCLYANTCSFILDFVVRQKIGGTNLNFFYVNQFPVLPPTAYTAADLDFIVPRVLELTYTSHSMTPFARDLGYDGDPFPWDEDRRATLRADLDAWYALAYGLSRDDLRYILDPKEIMGPDYPSETFRVLQKNDIKNYGYYRTSVLVLAAYDRLVAIGPVTNEIADKAWEYGCTHETDTLLMLAAIVKKQVGPMSQRELALAGLFATKPHLLMQHLDQAQKAEWKRLVGPEAELQANPSVEAFSRATPAAYKTAVARLRAEKSILAVGEVGIWDRGAAIYKYQPLPWADGRASFVLHAMKSIAAEPAIQIATAALPQTERDWFALAA